MSELVIDAFLQAGMTAVFISLIPLGAALVIGLLLSTLQAVTQIQEQSVTFVAKLVCASLALYLTRGYWVAQLHICFFDAFSAVAEL